MKATKRSSVRSGRQSGSCWFNSTCPHPDNSSDSSQRLFSKELTDFVCSRGSEWFSFLYKKQYLRSVWLLSRTGGRAKGKTRWQRRRKNCQIQTPRKQHTVSRPRGENAHWHGEQGQASTHRSTASTPLLTSAAPGLWVHARLPETTLGLNSPPSTYHNKL